MGPDESSPPITVQGALDALQAERDANWPADRLEANRALRARITTEADRTRFVNVGDVVEPFSLRDVSGGTIELERLLERGPVVLLFFRYEGCPADNVAIPAYRDTLAPELASLGVTLVGVSPQMPEKLVEIQRRHGLEFLVGSDVGAAVIERFGIGFAPTPEEQRDQAAAGADLGETLGDGSWTLPYPTVVVIGQDRIVRFVDVHPDWMVRTESADVIAAVRALS
jgi:peroxiredoxin